MIDLGFNLPDFTRMCGLYRQWNGKINVISRKDTDNILEHHVYHSLCIAQYLKNRRPDVFAKWRDEGATVLDLGCGGGFPGIPLASVFPKVRFTLCDSIGKKITVASSVADALGLTNVECVNARAEQLDGRWDVVVSRAVTSLDRLLPWVRGRYDDALICLKGGDIVSEIADCSAKLKGKMPPVDVWSISKVFKEEYFEEKYVVNLGV